MLETWGWYSVVSVVSVHDRTHYVENLLPATLMRSSDPSQEFADMAGKAQTVEWLVNHAQAIFKDTEPFPVS
jgi:hypothetical protein